MRSVLADRGIPWALVVSLLCLVLAAEPAAAGKIKLAVLKFGTVNWELDVIKTHGLDQAAGVELEVLELAGKNATSVALQAGAVDMIVNDWIWVSRQRAEGASFTFVPYSTAVGALVVAAGSPIRSLADLRGKRVGIAGGPLDKSWLLMRAFAAKRLGFDLDLEVEKVFGAPPLLNQQILAGRLDAVINFWHYVARLEAAGLRRVIGVDEVARGFGIATPVSLIGYVFDQALGDARLQDVMGFFKASRKAKEVLGASDAEWDRLRPLMKAPDDATFRALRDSYRRGIPAHWGEREREDARQVFAILAKLGGTKLTGKSRRLQDGTFWPPAIY